MNALFATLLALATLGGSSAALGAGHLSAADAAPSCTDVAGQADVCTDIGVDPNSGVVADVTADVHPTVPAAAAAATPSCTDLAGQADVCTDVSADPASGVNADVTADVHPTPPVAAPAVAAAPSCTDLAGQGSACTEVDPANGVVTVVVTVG